MKKRIIALALMLVMAFSALPLASAAALPFTDVPTYHKDRTAIEYCYNNGFIKGYSDTIFEPDGTLTREQYAVIWGRTFHLRLHKFNDVTKIPNEFDNAIIIMQGLGQVNGMSDTEFGRTSKISREQAIAITQRAYLPGIDGKDRYKDYTDNAQISDWARESVSICKQEGVLDGVFLGTALMPTQPITRGELCHMIFNIMRKAHTITVSSGIIHGAVAVENATTDTTGKIIAYPGETVTLKVTPEANYVLVPGSLKYNGTAVTGTTSTAGNYTFTMPFEDVTITADFAVRLESIAISETGTQKTTYESGQKLDLSGLVLRLTYASGNSREITSGYTASPVVGSTLNMVGTVEVTISYTENGVTKTVPLTITVTPKT